MTDNTEALPPHPSHDTVRDWMPVSEALRLADLWTVGDLDNSGQWRAAIKVLADEVRAALAQRQQAPLPENETREMHDAVMDALYRGASARTRTNELWQAYRSALLAAAPALTAAPSAQAEPQMVAPQDGMQFWLWKNGDHFLAFTHLYPCFTPGGDPMVLGEPVGRAVFRRSFHRSGRGNAIGPAQPELPKARSLTDELMDCVDRLGSEAKDVDPRVWDHLRVYMPAPQAAQAEPRHCPACGYELPAPPAAQAEPQVPLTLEQVALHPRGVKLWMNYATAFMEGIEFAERHHGIRPPFDQVQWPMSDREWAAQPANLREGCVVHVPGVGDL